METISLSLKQYVVKIKQIFYQKKIRYLVSNITTLLGKDAGATRFWSSGDGRCIQVRCKQNTKSYESLSAGGQRRGKLQETAKGKVQTPTAKTWNQIQRRAVERQTELKSYKPTAQKKGLFLICIIIWKIQYLNSGKGILLVLKVGNVSTKSHKYSYNLKDLDYKSTWSEKR